MWQIIIGSFLLSVVHATIPNHWLPFIAISKSEKWTIRETLSATGIAGLAHILSTIIIGVFVGFIGLQLSNAYSQISEIIAPSILVIIGIIYILIDFRKKNHAHINEKEIKERFKNKSKLTIITSLSVVMFLSPCAELEAYYFQAGTLGWNGILIVSAIYTFATVSFMILLVYLGLLGVNKFKFHYLEHHEKRVTGIFLILLGIAAYFIKF
jgi:nickel/cobalt transporter (NicO) family protein